MPTIKRAKIEVDLLPAPGTPLNLRFGVVYAPREPHPVFAGYSALEVQPDVFAVAGYQPDGVVTELSRGTVGNAYVRLATYLGM
jgi:hypothetical protein